MSRADEPGEQAALDETLARKAQRARVRATAEGARYGRSENVSHDRDAARNQCRCGEAIKNEVARVVGDNQGVVPACGECATNPSGDEISTTVKAVQLWRSQRATVTARRPDGDGGVREVQR